MLVLKRYLDNIIFTTFDRKGIFFYKCIKTLLSLYHKRFYKSGNKIYWLTFRRPERWRLSCYSRLTPVRASL
jgi:hypothetical protein